LTIDDPLIWEGNASLVDELVAEGIKPGAIVLSVGGGGLLCGVQRGLERHGWQDVRIIAVETEGAASFAAAQKAGKPVRLEAITSIATSLGALAVTHGTLTTKDSVVTESMVVSDKEAVRAMRKFADEERVLVEPACGAALAGVYEKDR
jgi:L-serine/L-threonine ammonia-lyase